MPDLSAYGVILCDEVRQEANGKYIIVGIYSGGIAAQSLPANMRLALYLIVKFENAGSQELIIEVASNGARARMELRAEILAPELLMHIPTPPFPLTLTDTSDIVVSLGLGEGELFEAGRFAVQVNPEIWTMYPNAQPLPDEQSQPADPD